MLGEGLVSCTSEEKKSNGPRQNQRLKKRSNHKEQRTGSKAQGKASTKAAQTPEEERCLMREGRRAVGSAYLLGNLNDRFLQKQRDKERERRCINEVTSQTGCVLVG